MTSAIEVRGLRAGYGSVPVLEELDLGVASGQFVVLTGPNGSGKSTLIKVVVGLIPAERGTVTVLGRSVSEPEARRRIGYAPQQGAGRMVLPVSVVEVVEAGLTPTRPILGNGGKDVRDLVASAIQSVGLTDLADECVFELSGGQQQRAVIARALAGDKPVLILDEPTTGIDSSFRPQMVQELRRRADQGAAVVVVSHDPDDFHEVTDRILFMEDGRLRYVSHEDFHAGGMAR